MHGRPWELHEEAQLNAPRGALREVARRLGRTYVAVKHRRGARHIAAVHRRWTPMELLWLDNRRIEGASYRELADELGRTVWAVSLAWRRASRRRGLEVDLMRSAE